MGRADGAAAVRRARGEGARAPLISLTFPLRLHLESTFSQTLIDSSSSFSLGGCGLPRDQGM